MDILLISASSVHWQNLIGGLNNLTGQNPIITVESELKNQQVNDMQKYIHILQTFSERSNKQEFSKRVLAHCFFSFLATFEENIMLGFLFKKCDLIILHKKARIKGQCSAIISGGLDSWFDFTVNFCAKDVSPEMRELANKILLHFEFMGLAFLWKEYKKTRYNDSVIIKDDSFVLETI